MASTQSHKKSELNHGMRLRRRQMPSPPADPRLLVRSAEPKNPQGNVTWNAQGRVAFFHRPNLAQ
jgi:hypothetical protein